MGRPSRREPLRAISRRITPQDDPPAASAARLADARSATDKSKGRAQIQELVRLYLGTRDQNWDDHQRVRFAKLTPEQRASAIQN
jgi:hypothetical protein